MIDEMQRTGVLVKPIWLMHYGLLIGLALAIGPAVFSSAWISSSDFHACIEMSSSFIAIIAGIFGLFYFLAKGSTFHLPLPQLIFSQQLIARPLDLISILVFLFAFVLGYKRLLVQKDSFTHFLLLSILLNALGQFYMSFSQQLFDIFFEVAHVANIVSYIMLVIGFLSHILHQQDALAANA